MEENILLDIVNLCLSIDKKSYKIYRKLSKTEKKKELKNFWTDLSKREKVPNKYWKELLYFAERGMIPQVFDNPFQAKEELEHINLETDMLLKNCGEQTDGINSFLLAYNLEFYLLHPAFVLLFHFMKTLPERETPEDNYGNHINNFINALNKYGTVTPELDLLGKIIKRLWRDNKLLTALSTNDTLTDLLNRRGLFDAINVLANVAKRHNSNVGVMMLDIDHFKKINDTYGHQKGDQALKQIADILKYNIRASDIIGRYGGEEFLIFLSPVELGALRKIAEKLRRCVEKETRQTLALTISIGVAKGIITVDVKTELDILIKKADEALYKAKNSGRNKTVVCE